MRWRGAAAHRQLPLMRNNAKLLENEEKGMNIPFAEIYITNRRLCAGSLVERVAMLATRKPQYIILREKDLSADDYQALAQRAIAGCEPCGVTCVLHSFVEVAKALKHPAIHLPIAALRGLPAAERQWFRVLGASCHSVAEAREAQSLGCTYITASHIFPTECKAGVPARGLDFLREVSLAVTIPVYALGGITPENRRACLAVGAAGTAIMSAAMRD